MNGTLNKLIDLLFPPRQTQLLLRNHSPINTFVKPGIHEGVFFCTQYDLPVMQAALLENKFHHHRKAQILLAEILQDWVSANQLTNVCFVPIPLGKERFRQRGHNQVTSILHQSHFSYESKVLKRTHETTPQASLARQQRLRNVKGIFTCDLHQTARLTAQTIVLLDDVVTTGATLNEARATLAPHISPHCTLICVALAH